MPAFQLFKTSSKPLKAPSSANPKQSVRFALKNQWLTNLGIVSQIGKTAGLLSARKRLALMAHCGHDTELAVILLGFCPKTRRDI
jgi:hypothetical protein